MQYVELAEGMLSMERVKVTDGWLWRNGSIGNMPEDGIGYFGKLAVEKAKDRL
jgi:hypothetical protein